MHKFNVIITTMAVGYQYQNEFSKKEAFKSNKKKLIILGFGLLFLGVIAIIGAPKQEKVIQKNPDQVVDTKELGTVSGLSLTDAQKAIKLNTDGFLITVKNGGDYKNFTTPLIYGFIEDQPSLLNNLKQKDINSCKLQTIEDGSADAPINIATYTCTNFYVILSTSISDKQNLESNDKVINWKILELEAS
jgi:hypothetical protein